MQTELQPEGQSSQMEGYPAKFRPNKYSALSYFDVKKKGLWIMDSNKRICEEMPKRETTSLYFAPKLSHVDISTEEIYTNLSTYPSLSRHQQEYLITAFI